MKPKQTKCVRNKKIGVKAIKGWACVDKKGKIILVGLDRYEMIYQSDIEAEFNGRASLEVIPVLIIPQSKKK